MEQFARFFAEREWSTSIYMEPAMVLACISMKSPSCRRVVMPFSPQGRW
jgi:hypothetical protein